MGMDIQAIKNKLKELDGTKPKKLIWKPEDEHDVRCLPLSDAEELGLEVGWHYGVGEGGRGKLYCPASAGEQCDFCDLAAYLYAWKDENGVDKPKATKQRDFEWFKKIQAGKKHYVPVIVRKGTGDEFDGPFFWEMSPRTYKMLLEKCVDDDYNAMHRKELGDQDPNAGGYGILNHHLYGLDVHVSLKKAGEKGNATKFDLTDIKERKMFSQLLSSKASSKELLGKVPAFSDAIKMASSKEVSQAFSGWKTNFDPSVEPPTRDPGLEYPTNSAEKLEGKGSVDETMAKLKKLMAEQEKAQAKA